MGVLEEGEGPRPGGILVLVQGFGFVREGRVTEGRGDGQSSLTSNVHWVRFFLKVGSVQIHVLDPIRRAGVRVHLLTEGLAEQGAGDLARRG